MDRPNINAIKLIDGVAAVLARLPSIGAEVYANGGRRGKPIVDKHFTQGNAERYGFAPLSAKYAARKRGQAPALRRAQKAAGRPASKLAGGNLPLLVRSGDLRAAVDAGGHQITQSGDTATVTFDGLPDYAPYLQEGTGRMPARSPVDPSAEDIAEVAKEMEKALSAAVGTGGSVRVSPATVPGMARVI